MEHIDFMDDKFYQTMVVDYVDYMVSNSELESEEVMDTMTILLSEVLENMYTPEEIIQAIKEYSPEYLENLALESLDNSPALCDTCGHSGLLSCQH